MYTKALSENYRVGFPNILTAAYPRKARMLSVAMEKLRLRFEEKLSEMVGPQWVSFEGRLNEALKQWIGSGRMLFCTPGMETAGASEENINNILKSNHRLMCSIDELVHSTRYRRTDDKVADLKLGMKNIIDLLEAVSSTDVSFPHSSLRHV